MQAHTLKLEESNTRAKGARFDEQQERRKSVLEKSRLSEQQDQIGSLEREIRPLQVAHDILKKSNELLKETWASPPPH